MSTPPPLPPAPSASASAPPVASASASSSLPALRLARLLVRFRFRHSWNAWRARPSGPLGLLVLFLLASSAAYVVLLKQALQVLQSVDAAGTGAVEAALMLVAGTIAAASLASRAAGGSEAALAGSPENEFFFARPVSLPALVVARSVAGPLTDPFGSLFLLPALLAAALVWQLPPLGWLVAVATALAAQIGIAALAQAVQIAVVRWVPRRHRPFAWMALRLSSVLAVAAVWVSATWVLRSPEWLVPRLPGVARVLQLTPAAALSAPLAAFRHGGPAAALPALLPIAALAAAAVALAVAVARRAGRRGWEEAGAPYADAGATAPPGPPLGPVRREWRLLRRDRSRLLALVALPITFIGVQLVGSVGWSWATATVDRAAALAFSFALYLATLGPLGHMQGERRAFWIAFTVPVPVGTLMAAKVKAWAPLLAATAGVVFAALAAGVPGARAGDVAVAGLLVVGGAVVMTVVAVALAAGAADLSDPDRAAIGPGTVYLFMLVGGLYNLVLHQRRGAAILVPLALYLAVVVATWRTGMAHVARCFDAEALARRTVRLADAALLLLLAGLLPRAVAAGMEGVAAAPDDARWIGPAAVKALIGAGAAIYLLRRRPARSGAGGVVVAAAASGLAASLAIGAAAGLAGVAAAWLFGGTRTAAALAGSGAGGALALPLLALLAGAALADELILRGTVQRALEAEIQPRFGPRTARAVAAVAAVAAALLVSVSAQPLSVAATVVVAVAPAAARAAAGTLAAALAARLILLVAALAAMARGG